MSNLFQKQLDLEEKYRSRGRAKMMQAYASAQAAETCLGRRMVSHAFDRMTETVADFICTTVSPKTGVKPAYWSCVADMVDVYKDSLEEAAAVMTLATLRNLLNSSLRSEYILSNIAQAIGTDIYNEVRLQAYLNSGLANVKAIESGIKSRAGLVYKLAYATHHMAETGFTWRKWAAKDKTALGAKLIEIAIQTTGYWECPPMTYRYNGKSAVSEMRPTQRLLDTWQRNYDRLLDTACVLVPTIIPPKPWTGITDGGYFGALAGEAQLIRVDMHAKDAYTKSYLARLNEVDLSRVMSVLNAIQETPWRINSRVLDVVEKIIALGGDIGGIARIAPYPEVPDLVGEYTEEEKRENRRKKHEWVKREIARKSKALRVMMHLQIAKEFSEYDRIYFPVNMDFRGRIYPIPPFSYQGDDLSKALLLLADPPECQTMEDIEWLAIHGANLAGVDKVSFADRLAWIRENEKHILASAKDPLGYRWWADQDKPLQFLAFCFEWSRWRDHERTYGTPRGFKTGIPIAFDGTCSGLQHYSALLRDPIGGQAVNLIPGDKPSDIYAIVADKVTEILHKDAIHGTPDGEATSKDGDTYLKLGTKTLAQQWLSYGVNRKVTKRSVMTLAYGSKEYGFGAQVMEDTIMTALMEGKGEMFTHPKQAAKYMAKCIWKAVQTTVVKAVEGMAWLQNVARLVCKEGQVVTWVTPLGLPVQQAYLDKVTKQFRLRFAGIEKRFYATDPTGYIDRRKQANAIAPNVIHSLDASHLQLTVLLAKDAGINHFSLIHDSFGTTVADAGKLFKIVREAFVKLYTEYDPLKQFKEDMELLLEAKDRIPPLPEKGNLDINVVKESLYAFH